MSCESSKYRDFWTLNNWAEILLYMLLWIIQKTSFHAMSRGMKNLIIYA